MNSLCGLGYNKLYSTYLSVFKDMAFDVDKIEYNNIKYCLLNHIQSVNQIISNEYYLEVNPEYIKKSIWGDIEYFYTRAIIQNSNVYKSINRDSPDWNFVTNYYLYFFSAMTIQRMTFRGTFYLDSISASQVSSVITALTGNLIQLKAGNFSFSIPDPSGNIIKIKSESGKGTHEILWKEIAGIISELYGYCTVDDEEKQMLAIFHDYYRSYPDTFPSGVRNYVNYNQKVGFDITSKQFEHNSFVENQNDWFVKVLKLDPKDDIESKIRCVHNLGRYIVSLSLRLYIDYCTRNNISLHTKERLKYIKDRKLYFNRLI